MAIALGEWSARHSASSSGNFAFRSMVWKRRFSSWMSFFALSTPSKVRMLNCSRLMRPMSTTVFFQSVKGSTLRSGSLKSMAGSGSPPSWRSGGGAESSAAAAFLLGEAAPEAFAPGDAAPGDLAAAAGLPPAETEAPDASKGLLAQWRMKECVRTSPRGAVGWPAALRIVGTFSSNLIDENNDGLVEQSESSPPGHVVDAADIGDVGS
mmetsp:Transcript_63369/g.182395  ORF Transcript_63369/g.182395 Transcript_63369/m.182395 type:complete len:209 (+) Transcript_63369:394-1020(+)